MIGIYGTGYLGKQFRNYLNREKHSCIILDRHQPETHAISIVIDASFPRNYKDISIFRQYLCLLEDRLVLSETSGSKYIYIGSYSSGSQVSSKYGLGKKAAEDLVLQHSGTVLRLGLVVDQDNPGGRYLEFLNFLRKIPLRFIFPEGWCPVYVTELRSALNFLHTIISDKKGIPHGYINVPETKKIYLYQLLTEIYGNSSMIKVPETVMWILSYLVNICPVGKIDNLKSIMYKEIHD